MPTIPRIDGFADELTGIRRDFHAHPEIGFEEHRTSGVVAEKLADRNANADDRASVALSEAE